MAQYGERPVLPVWATVTASYAYLFKHWLMFLFPALLYLALNAGLIWMGSSFQNADPTNALEALKEHAGSLTLSVLLLISFWIVTCISIHRAVVLDEIWTGFGFLKFNFIFFQYILTFILLFIIQILTIFAYTLAILLMVLVAKIFSVGEFGSIAIGLNILTVLIFIAGIGFSIHLSIRLNFAYTATAVGIRDRFSFSWHATRGNCWRLFWVMFFVMLPIIFVTGYMTIGQTLPVIQAAIAHHPLQNTLQILTPAQQLVQAVLQLISYFLAIIAISLCYRQLVSGMVAKGIPLPE